MIETYNHSKIEEKWQKHWDDTNAFKVDVKDSKDKYYVLEMFPYPSGKIHMGHVRNYTLGDVIARYFNMQGKNVLHPMGWDSFGLPAENAAIENNLDPEKWTLENIESMKIQLKRLGLSYDWDREIATCTPTYYKWSQWIFLKFLEHDLAYKKKSKVNWCETCVTVLANEQVEEGVCWRCDNPVTERELDQWFFKITDYAEELLSGLDKLKGWPSRVVTMQENWIGKSVGAEVDFKIDGLEEKIKIFTTRPDTLYGVTFMSLAPDHPLVDVLTTEENKVSMRDFCERFKSADATEKRDGTLEKEGVFTGSFCINPLTNEKVPVYAANFVLMGYGTGAVMAVPAHDQRDFEFAKEYNIDIKVVIQPKGENLDASKMEEAFTEAGVMVNSDKFDAMESNKAKEEIVVYLEEKNFGCKSINFRLRDWGISRQRYWGCPIPVIYCEDCGTVPVEEKDLPLLLPKNVDLNAKGLSPLENVDEFVNCKCPKCGKDAKRETDTMDTFVDSSWYFLRYISSDNDDLPLPFDKKDATNFMPVDRYIGGIEHAVMHLLYARFFTKALRDIGLVDIDEPFENLLTQGMVCMELFKCDKDGFLYPEEVKDNKCIKCGGSVKAGQVEKMSKSKKNVVDPNYIIEKYGTDTARLFILFAAPPERDLDWSIDGVEGASRFLGRVWRLVYNNIDILKNSVTYNGEALKEKTHKELYSKIHDTIHRVTRDIDERFHFNTAISAIMELVNDLYKFDVKESDVSASIFKEAINSLVILLSPFAPHISEELWKELGNSTDLVNEKWLSYNKEALKKDAITIVVQIMGKLRSKVEVPVGASEEEVRGFVMKDAKTKEHIEEKTIVKFIYVPGKLVNIVVR